MIKSKIVITEDDRELSQLLAQRLRDEGYEVYQAEDGQKGLLKVQTEKPDLLIVDLAMPKLSGNRMIRILRDDPGWQGLPIIMLSAFVTPETKAAIEIPADCYMSKPFNEELLISKIEELISKSGRQSALV